MEYEWPIFVSYSQLTLQDNHRDHWMVPSIISMKIITCTWELLTEWNLYGTGQRDIIILAFLTVQAIESSASGLHTEGTASVSRCTDLSLHAACKSPTRYLPFHWPIMYLCWAQACVIRQHNMGHLYMGYQMFWVKLFTFLTSWQHWTLAKKPNCLHQAILVGANYFSAYYNCLRWLLDHNLMVYARAIASTARQILKNKW